MGAAIGDDGLDRCAHLRADSAGISRLLAAEDAGVLAFWHGRPLVAAKGGAPRLARLAPDHRLFAGCDEAPIFLGVSHDGPVFARQVPDGADAGVPPPAGGPFDDGRYPHPAAPEGHRFVDLRHVMGEMDGEEGALAATGRALLAWHRGHGHCSRCGAVSRVVEAGWQRLCPSCGTRHFPRTDPVVIMLVTSGNSVLLGRSAGWPDGMVSLLAGFVEPGETIENAVRREVMEETGVRIGAVGYLASQPWPFPASLMIGCKAQALSRAITLDPVELESAFWISREELLDVLAGTRSDIVLARRGSIARFLLRGWLAQHPV